MIIGDYNIILFLSVLFLIFLSDIYWIFYIILLMLIRLLLAKKKIFEISKLVIELTIPIIILSFKLNKEINQKKYFDNNVLCLNFFKGYVVLFDVIIIENNIKKQGLMILFFSFFSRVNPVLNLISLRSQEHFEYVYIMINIFLKKHKLKMETYLFNYLKLMFDALNKQHVFYSELLYFVNFYDLKICKKLLNYYFLNNINNINNKNLNQKKYIYNVKLITNKVILCSRSKNELDKIDFEKELSPFNINESYLLDNLKYFMNFEGFAMIFTFKAETNNGEMKDIYGISFFNLSPQNKYDIKFFRLYNEKDINIMLLILTKYLQAGEFEITINWLNMFLIKVKELNNEKKLKTFKMYIDLKAKFRFISLIHYDKLVDFVKYSIINKKNE